MNPRVWSLALKAAESAKQQGIGGKNVLGIIDYSIDSAQRRFWVLDLEQKKVLFHEWVAHGKGSGQAGARLFSNKPGSFQSSLGLFLAESAYVGKHGYSLKLRGLEPTINSNAQTRAIVIHGAWYVDEGMVSTYGRLGRSWGCPAVRQTVAVSVIDSLKDGGLLFAYFPDDHWLSTSRFLI